MKAFIKILSAMLAVILMTLMATAISAEEVKYKLDPRFFEEYGQKTYILGEPTELAPIVDGSIQTNEYALKVETTLSEGYVAASNYNTGADWTVDWANAYVSYDEECLYLAAEIHDPTHTVYGQWEGNLKRADQFAFAIGGMWIEPDSANWDPITSLCSHIDFRFFDGNTEEEKANTGYEDFFEIENREKNFMDDYVGSGFFDVSTYTRDHKVVYDETTQVATYEVAIYWDAIKKSWPHHEENVQFDLLTFGLYIQDTVLEEIPDKNIGHRAGIMWWGTQNEQTDAAFESLLDEYNSVATYGKNTGRVVPNMLFFGTQEEYDAYKASCLVVDVPETEAPETEAPETEAPAGETEAPAGETNAPETNAPVAGDEKGGCGSYVAAVGVALVAALGTCTAFVSKKR